ncbi:glycine cleavage system protein H [Nocardia brasiliensis]|uniref:glycine cleavage system protein H n=1 Tax=Nocardia brasiliensis TaxID=37326 RepID=UPI00366F25CE
MSERRFTADHSWAELANGVVTVGLTGYIEEQLGSIVHVEFYGEGEPARMPQVRQAEAIGSVESEMASRDIFAPVGGEIIEVNTRLSEEPELINEAPEAEGWFCTIRLGDRAEFHALMSEADYRKFCAESP